MTHIIYNPAFEIPIDINQIKWRHPQRACEQKRKRWDIAPGKFKPLSEMTAQSRRKRNNDEKKKQEDEERANKEAAEQEKKKKQTTKNVTATVKAGKKVAPTVKAGKKSHQL